MREDGCVKSELQCTAHVPVLHREGHLLDVLLNSANQIFHGGLCCSTGSDVFG